MGKELLKGMKRCSTSTSTDGEASDHKDKKPLQISESELQSSETHVKKQKKRKKKSKSKQIDDEDDLELDEDEKTSDDKKEMKKLRKSFKEMTQTMKNLQDFFMAKPDPPGMSLKDLLVRMVPKPPSKEEEEPPKKLETYECCFETEDADGDRESIFVHGFDTSLARDDIKTALREYFESGGLEVTKVFVPIVCPTGVPLGFAFIDVDDDQKALRLRGGLVRGRMLHVLMAQDQRESGEFPNFRGCKHCGKFLSECRAERFQRYLSSYRR